MKAAPKSQLQIKEYELNSDTMSTRRSRIHLTKYFIPQRISPDRATCWSLVMIVQEFENGKTGDTILPVESNSA